MSAAHNTAGNLPAPYRVGNRGAATTPGHAASTPSVTINVPGQSDAAQGITAPPRTQMQQTWDSFRSHRAAFIGLCVLLTMAVICTVGPFVLQDPAATDLPRASTGPSAAHLFGTDPLGRDVLSRLVNAGRISLLIGFSVAFGAAGIGAAVGVCAGYFGGKVDSGLMWIASV
ncbi:MAG: diguanylate cyclase, partial [Thermoleophilia bacterium]|nr:diguanylate cyclase [Thermoleophilia bacterium]